jgi:hypothetical protein
MKLPANIKVLFAREGKRGGKSTSAEKKLSAAINLQSARAKLAAQREDAMRQAIARATATDT